MNNILFIGGAGFIGSAIIKEMLAQDTGAHIVVLEPPHAASRTWGAWCSTPPA